MEKNNIKTDLDKLADLFGFLLEKYADKIDIKNLFENKPIEK